MFKNSIRFLAWTLYRNIVRLNTSLVLGLKKGSQFDDLPKAPYILVCNHANYLDPWFFAQYSREPLQIMVNEDALWDTPFTVFLRHRFLGMYPKKKGVTDPKAIKQTIKYLKEGKSILIFPEGQSTWDGETQPIYTGVEKIAKKMQVPLVLHNLQGNFLLHPWWAKAQRKGQVLTTRKVLSVEQITEMSIDEIREEVISYISTNDIKNDENLTRSFKGENLALGMEQILWICPECGSEDQLSPLGNAMLCDNCKNKFTFTPYLRLTSSVGNENILDFYDWHQHQIKVVQSNLTKNLRRNLTEDSSVSLITLNTQGEEAILDTGALSLTTQELIFKGLKKTLIFPFNMISSPVSSKTTHLLFTYNKQEYRFVIEKSALFKWVTYLREATGYREAVERGYY